MDSESEHQGKDTAQLNSAHYIEPVQSIASEFETHFTDFSSLEPVTTVGTGIDVDDIVSKLETFFFSWTLLQCEEIHDPSE